MDSRLTRPAADRVMSGPEAFTSGTTPKTFQRIAPRPSKNVSPPRIESPCTRTTARQTIPRSHRMTCSAENGDQPLSLISPCICSRTADANRVPGAIACSRYFLAGSGSSDNRAGSNARSYDGAEFHSPTRFYKNSIMTYTYGKALLTPGQRVGYIALSPFMDDLDELRTIIYSTRF